MVSPVPKIWMVIYLERDGNKTVTTKPQRPGVSLTLCIVP